MLLIPAACRTTASIARTQTRSYESEGGSTTNRTNRTNQTFLAWSENAFHSPTIAYASSLSTISIVAPLSFAFRAVLLKTATQDKSDALGKRHHQVTLALDEYVRRAILGQHHPSYSLTVDDH